MSKYRVGDHDLSKVRGGEILYIEITTKSYITNTGELTGFGDFPPPCPTTKPTIAGICLHGMLAFVSVSCYTFLWMWQSTGEKKPTTLLFPSPPSEQT